VFFLVEHVSMEGQVTDLPLQKTVQDAFLEISKNTVLDGVLEGSDEQ
jgi:hypothetical protein